MFLQVLAQLAEQLGIFGELFHVVALVLLNPWVRSTATLARTQIKLYYGQRLLQREFWLKLLYGQVGIIKAVKGLFRSILIAGSRGRERKSPIDLSYQQKMADQAF